MKLRPSLTLLPLTPLYRLGLAANNAAYGWGWRSAKRLRWPVVSIGNLSVGGAGKTPLTICLARLLAANGFSVDVLSRGYGRSSRGVARVDPAGDAAQYGDEPLLMAREAGVPVFVGESRYEAGLLAERALLHTPEPHMHLLDDGLQHRELARAVEIVLLHRSDFDEVLLPAGRLREPLAALRRADIVVLRKEDAELEAHARIHAQPQAIFWQMQRKLVVPEALRRGVAFCGIARPAEFFAGLRNGGATLAATAAWRDHHRYTPKDISRLQRLAAAQRADAFVTTAKDAVKLSGELRAKLQRVAPLLTAELEVSFTSGTDVVEELRGLLRREAEPNPL